MTSQHWYNGRGPVGHYDEMCQSRGHILISLSGVEDGSGLVAKGSITFHCCTCDSEVTTTVASYCASGNSSTKGCRVCKSIAARAREAERNASRPPSRHRARRRRWSNNSPFNSREDIRQHLLAEENPHNTRMLELMDRGGSPVPSPAPTNSEGGPGGQGPQPPLAAGSQGTESWHTTYEVHHIIPRHDGGVNRVFNEISLTRYEHWEIHLLRFEAYRQYGDVYVFHFCWGELPEEFKARLRANPLACRYLASAMAGS